MDSRDQPQLLLLHFMRRVLVFSGLQAIPLNSRAMLVSSVLASVCMVEIVDIFLAAFHSPYVSSVQSADRGEFLL